MRIRTPLSVIKSYFSQLSHHLVGKRSEGPTAGEVIGCGSGVFGDGGVVGPGGLVGVAVVSGSGGRWC